MYGCCCTGRCVANFGIMGADAFEFEQPSEYLSAYLSRGFRIACASAKIFALDFEKAVGQRLRPALSGARKCAREA